MSERTPRDYLLYGALGCALVGTAHAEYTLAVTAHFNEYVALAVPGALDLYVLRALQQRRDVFVAVLAMVAANVTAHLLTAGVLHEHWAITSAAGALAPLILWRVYSLKHTRNRQELLWEVPAGAMSAPAPERVPVTPMPTAHAPWCGLSHPDDGLCSEYGAPAALQWPDSFSVPAPDHVPADWMDAEYPETHPSAPAPDPLFAPGARTYLEDALGLNAQGISAPAPHLRSVPDLPAEYAPGAVHSESPLRDDDLPFLPGAQEYVDNAGKSASVRGMKKAVNVGQDRAERLLTHLGVIL